MSTSSHLLSPLAVGRRTFRNRVVMLPHATLLADSTGLPTQRQAAYYAERAAGGVAAMVMGGAIVHPNSFAGGGQNALWKPEAVAGYREIARAVHSHGALMLSQLSFTGNKGPSHRGRQPIWAPSPIPYVGLREIPKEMTTDEIETIIAAFVQAALYLEDGEFDGVEVFAAQGYGLSQFLSPATNHRTDAYGGSHERRLRIVLQILERIRARVSPDFLVGIRLNGADFVEGGLTIEDAAEIARTLDTENYVDYISVSAGMRGLIWIADMTHELAPFASLAARIRNVVRIPVVCATRIKTPAHAERILAQGTANLIGMARALIADPRWVEKAAAGNDAQICGCLSCNQDCLGRILRGVTIGCVQNPAAGNESEWGRGTLRWTQRRKRVMVIGGGPAGMETARVAAMRGHEVILYERNARLGGQVNLATLIECRRELEEVIRFREYELRRLGVTIETDAEITSVIVKGEAPDVVVVATGSRPRKTGWSTWQPARRRIPGADLDTVLTVWDALHRPDRIGHRVLIVDEDPHLQATALAEHLADSGHTVTVMTAHRYVGIDLPPAVLGPTYTRLRQKGVAMRPHTLLDIIEQGTVHVSDLFTGEAARITGIDTVVLAMGNVAENSLYRDLKASDVTVYAAGDCVAPRLLGNAIYEGHAVGRRL